MQKRRAPLLATEPIKTYLESEFGQSTKEKMRRRGEPGFPGQTMNDRIRAVLIASLPENPPPTFRELACRATIDGFPVSGSRIESEEKRFATELRGFARGVGIE